MSVELLAILCVVLRIPSWGAKVLYNGLSGRMLGHLAGTQSSYFWKETNQDSFWDCVFSMLFSTLLDRSTTRRGRQGASHWIWDDQDWHNAADEDVWCCQATNPRCLMLSEDVLDEDMTGARFRYCFPRRRLFSVYLECDCVLILDLIFWECNRIDVMSCYQGFRPMILVSTASEYGGFPGSARTRYTSFPPPVLLAWTGCISVLCNGKG